MCVIVLHISNRKFLGVNPLQPGVAFLYPLKTGFLMFSGGIEKQQWAELG